jgi:hypothetical protein
VGLTTKLLITLTLNLFVAKAWMLAVSVTTVGIMANKSNRLTEAQKQKTDDLTGRATLKAVGLTLWMGTLVVLVWIFL